LGRDDLLPQTCNLEDSATDFAQVYLIKRITTRRLDQSRVDREKELLAAQNCWRASHNPADGRDTNPSNPTLFLLLNLEPNFRRIYNLQRPQPFPGDISATESVISIPGFSRVGGSGQFS
jgi:hypothetical protein